VKLILYLKLEQLGKGSIYLLSSHLAYKALQ